MILWVQSRGLSAKRAVRWVAAVIVLGAAFTADPGFSHDRPMVGGECRSETAAESVPVPGDAVLPEAASGFLKHVGPGATARQKLCYGASTSIFHDGTKSTAADLLYAYAFAYRWGTEGGDGYDPEIGRSTALMRQRLVGIKVVGIDKASKSIRVGDFAFIRELVLVDVYLNGPTADRDGAASVAPPWSAVPWHVLALMEAAVQRGWAAFSEAEAARLGVPWLDLARSALLKEKLAALVDEFAAKGYRPGTLEPLVSGEEARKRWAALKAYYGDNGHFLITNGPYRLAGWPDDATVLKVFRDITYPLGVGSYDAYAVPRNAHITAVEPVDAGFALAVDIERMEKFMRSYKIVREPLAGAGADALKRQTLECRYVVVTGDRQVRLAGQGRLGDDGRMVIDLAGKLPPGDYIVLATLYLNGNTVGQDVRRIPYRVR